MSATDKAVELVQTELAEKETELEKVAGPLVEEVNVHKKWLKKNTKGTAASAPAVSDEDLLAAVGHVAKSGPAKSTDIAKFLGVDPRTISRRLSAWAKSGDLQGDKDSGYSI